MTTDKIADYAIVEIKLADGSVTSAKIKDGTIIAEDLNTGAVSEIKIQDYAVTTNKIADYAVTSLKLSAYAIPFNSTYSRTTADTIATSWQPMPAMSVNITLTRTSCILIMLNLEAYVATAGDWMAVRALVNTTEAYPKSSNQFITRVIGDNLGSYSCNFYLPDASAGVSSVKIEYKSWNGARVYAGDRTLIVIALPS